MSGITGILRPNGEFVSCNYGNHCTIAIDIPEEEGEFCIYLSSSFDSSLNSYENSTIYFPTTVTKAQLLWLMKNIDTLDVKQYEVWIKYINEVNKTWEIS